MPYNFPTSKNLTLNASTPKKYREEQQWFYLKIILNKESQDVSLEWSVLISLVAILFNNRQFCSHFWQNIIHVFSKKSFEFFYLDLPLKQLDLEAIGKKNIYLLTPHIHKSKVGNPKIFWLSWTSNQVCIHLVETNIFH